MRNQKVIFVQLGNAGISMHCDTNYKAKKLLTKFIKVLLATVAQMLENKMKKPAIKLNNLKLQNRLKTLNKNNNLNF